MSQINKGESLYIPFKNGKSIYDSQNRPRMYKTVDAFEKHFPAHHTLREGVELVEYAPTIDAVPVVRCGECEYQQSCFLTGSGVYEDDDFCSKGARMDAQTGI